MNTVYRIYTLAHPITGEVRYVGKTNQKLSYRLNQHLLCSVKGAITYKSNWIKSLIFEGLYPIIEEIEETENPVEREIYWIGQFRAWGFRLTNMTDGGDGNNNQVRSRSAYSRVADKLRGVPRPQSVRDKISASHRGKVLSEETKLKLRLANLGKSCPESFKERFSKVVIQLDTDNVQLSEYSSLAIASQATGASKGAISNVCKGRQRTAGGYKWRYAD